MKFGPVPLDQAEGKILGHNVTGRGRSSSAAQGSRVDGTGHRAACASSAGGWLRRGARGGRRRRGPAGAARERAVVGRAYGSRAPERSRQSIRRLDRRSASRRRRAGAPQPSRRITLATLVNVRGGGGEDGGHHNDTSLRGPETAVRDVESAAAGRPAILRVDALPAPRGLVLAARAAPRSESWSGFRAASSRVSMRSARRSRRATTWCSRGVWRGSVGAAIERQPRREIESCCGGDETRDHGRHDIAPRAVELAGGEVVLGRAVDPGKPAHARYVGSVPVIGARLRAQPQTKHRRLGAAPPAGGASGSIGGTSRDGPRRPARGRARAADGRAVGSELGRGSRFVHFPF